MSIAWQQNNKPNTLRYTTVGNLVNNIDGHHPDKSYMDLLRVRAPVHRMDLMNSLAFGSYIDVPEGGIAWFKVMHTALYGCCTYSHTLKTDGYVLEHAALRETHTTLMTLGLIISHEDLFMTT